MIEIRSRYDGSIVYTAENAANVRQAVEEAVRTGANLSGANLTGANLSGANLYGAYLTGANLYGADLTGARGLSPSLANPLELLTIQTGKLRAWKLTGADAKSCTHTGAKPLIYKVGKTVKAKANPDTRRDCGAGVNLATLAWVRRWYKAGDRVFLCEFDAASLVMPDYSDGKFRVFEALVVGELVL